MNPEPDLIDRIANALPDELRADYYRELRHCRSLPENDEMLRILRVMQFLVVLTVQVPDRMATDRQQFERVVADAIQMLQETRQFTAAHQAQLDRRLAQVSAHIAEELKPEAVAAAINESLRQQFFKSTIPETADTLAVAAAQIKKAAAEFMRVAGTLGDAYRDAVSEANTSIEKLKSTCTDALSGTKRAVEELRYLSGKQHRQRFSGFLILAFILGAGLHWLYGEWRHKPPPEVNPAPVVQCSPTINPRSKPKANGRLAMLTIRAMSDGKGYSSRHLEHSDYYAEGELVTGVWQGRGQRRRLRSDAAGTRSAYQGILEGSS